MGVISTLTNMYQDCIETCTKCAQACRECLMIDLKEDDVADRTKCICILNECERMCCFTAEIMTMVGQSSKSQCALCAEVCDMCAEECGKFKDNHTMKCVNVLNDCAQECRKMAAM